MFGRLVLILAFGALWCGAQTRRALIIGIDTYQTHPVAEKENAGPVVASKGVRIGAQPARKTRDTWPNLDGAVDDAKAYRDLLITRFGFRAEDIVFLTDKKAATKPDEIATRQRILERFQKYLIDDAKPGDVSVFIYAGHGSQRLNMAETIDENGRPKQGLDQTFVPADSEDGAEDIRDKEMVRLYRRAVERRVTLTVIADSCHSGGMMRGPKSRSMPTANGFVTDPPDRDKDGHLLPDPTQQGVLVIGAAEDNQSAQEMRDDKGNPHGVFTHYFTKALMEAPPKSSVARIFARTIAMMRSAGQMQLPAMAGDGRIEQGLFGEPADDNAGITVPVEEVHSDKTVILRGGLAIGLSEGSELVGVKNKDVRLQIEGQPTLARATARIIAGGPVQGGDEFRLDRWIVNSELVTRFYLPSAGLPSFEQVKAFANAMQELAKDANIQLIDDPTITLPTDVLRLSGARWELEARTPTGPRKVDLGASPTAAAVVKALGPGNHGLYINYPPPKELADAIRARVAPGANAVEFHDRRDGVIYEIAGTLHNGRLIYTWMLPAAAPSDSESLAIPVRTNWVDAEASAAAIQLEQYTLNVARLRVWLGLEVPVSGDESPFPYKLALKKVGTGTIKTSGDIIEGEHYAVVLRAVKTRGASPSTAPVQRRIYIAVIDRSGGMRPIFPAENSTANLLPAEGQPDEIVLMPDLTVSKPLGIDTMVMVASEEPFDPGALVINPVQTRGGITGSRGEPRSLTRFLFDVRAGTRGFGTAPTNWSVERVTFRSLPKSTTGAPK